METTAAVAVAADDAQVHMTVTGGVVVVVVLTLDILRSHYKKENINMNIVANINLLGDVGSPPQAPLPRGFEGCYT